MGCFFGCFRIKDSKANLVAPSKEPVAPRSKNALSSLFLTDDGSPGKGVEAQNHLSREPDIRELKDEAKILKASGTLSETSIKVQKTLDKWEALSAPNEAEKSSKFNSWLQNASIDKSPIPAKTCEVWVAGSSPFLDSPSSCMTDGHDSKSASSSSIQRSVQNVDTPKVRCDSEACSEISSVSTQVIATGVQSKKKSVRFNYSQDTSALSSKGSSECVSPHSKQSGSAGMGGATKSSLYPVPLKFDEEMQTPGTVFPEYRKDTTNSQVSMLRSQYVISVLDPAENPSQRNKLKDESSDSNLSSESVNVIDDRLMSAPALDHSVRKEMKNEAGLSSWLKPISVNQEYNNKRLSCVSSENVHLKRTPADRPILGMVAAHWNDDVTSHISPKWWDGNGIPNSTNKYKEDQKVSWHATPFEERLEKALSDESLLSQRKPINRTAAFELNETEESDTALSHLQSSPHLKSVVSF